MATLAPSRSAASPLAASKKAGVRAERAGARRYDPAETRGRVAEAAYQLFSQRGYQATSTADIARAAEVSEGSIFYHFGSKGGLLAELGRLHGEKMVAAMEGDQPLGELDLATSLARCFDFCEANSAWEQLAHAEDRLADRCGQPGEAEPFFHAARAVTQAWTERHLKARLAARRGAGADTGADKGEAPEAAAAGGEIDVEVAAGLIFAAVADAIALYLRPGTTEERREAIRAESIRFITAAVEGAPSRGEDPR